MQSQLQHGFRWEHVLAAKTICNTRIAETTVTTDIDVTDVLMVGVVPYRMVLLLQVLLGLRNGTMLQLTAQQTHSPAEPTHADPFQHPTPAVSHSCGSGRRVPQLQLAAMKHLGSLPVVLIQLPTAVGLKGSSLALSDRMALLSCAPGTGRAVASPLAVAGVTHAVPLWQPATSATGVFHSRYADTRLSQQSKL